MPSTRRWDVQLDVHGDHDIRPQANTAINQLLAHLGNDGIRCGVAAFDADGNAYNTWDNHADTVAAPVGDTPRNPVNLHDASNVHGFVVFIWDGHLVTAPVTGHSLDYPGQLIVDATHPVTKRSEFKHLWRADVVPADASASH